MLDSSDYYFHQGYELAMELNNLDFQGVLAGNLGENLYIRKQFEEAIPFLRIDVSRCLIAHDWSSGSNALTILGDIYLTQGNLPRASQLLDSALVFSHRSVQIRRLAVVYPRLAKLYAVKSHAQLARLYIDSSLFANDSLAREKNRFSATRAQQRVRLDNMQAKTLEQEFQFENRLQQRNYLVLMVLLIAVIVGLILNQRRLKAKLGQQVAEEKRAEAEQNLANAQQRLNTFVEHVQQLQQEITHQSESEFFGSQSKRDVNDLENSVIFTERQWREFSDLFESVHPGFFQRLDERLSGLTAAEIRFLALSRMRLGNKEMASMLAISTDAVRQTRSRLKRKLALEISLEQFALEV
jgi:DNA-binding CsgD family transcriptional regulator